MAPPWLRRQVDNISVNAVPVAPAWRDWIITAAYTVFAVLEFTLSSIDVPPEGVAITAVAVTLLPWRRRIPLITALLACATYLMVVIPHWGQTAYDGIPQTYELALFVLCYAVCRWTRPDRLAVAVPTILATSYIGGLGESGSVMNAVGNTAVPWIAIIVVAVVMRQRANLMHQRAEQRIARTRLSERHALARELHDLIAHHVSAIAVQAQAAQVVGDANITATTLRAIEQTASTALVDLRRLVGILRSDEPHVPILSADGLTALTVTPMAPPVTLAGDIDLAELPKPVAGAVYRIAQEAITNARRHSRHTTGIDVVVRRHPRHVEIAVTNDGVPKARAGHGFGLVGMRERVEAFGGSFSAGPRASGGWLVQASIPVESWTAP